MKKTVLAIMAVTVLAAFAQTAKPVVNSFTDKRDGKTYRIVKIGTQTWMAENLNFKTDSSKCYNNIPDSCAKYGRLYNWNTALTACPAGWHLPSDDEWRTLIDAIGGDELAGTKLKSKTGWNSYKGKDGNGTDDYGFSALPGGGGYSDGVFSNAGNFGLWWSATEDFASYAWYRDMSYGYEGVYRDYYDETFLFSVRCIQDGGQP